MTSKPVITAARHSAGYYEVMVEPMGTVEEFTFWVAKFGNRWEVRQHGKTNVMPVKTKREAIALLERTFSHTYDLEGWIRQVPWWYSRLHHL